MRKALVCYLLLVAICFLAGCGNGDDVQPTVSAGSILAGAASKGPFQGGAKVSVFKIDSTGNLEATPSWTGTVKDKLGNFEIDLGSYTGPVEVQVTGKYYDEATGQEKTTDEAIKAVVYANSGKTSVNPNILTTLASEKAKALIKQGKDAKEAIEQAYDEVKAIFGLGDEVEIEGLAMDDLTDVNNCKFFALNYAFTSLIESSGLTPTTIINLIAKNISQEGAKDINLSSEQADGKLTNLVSQLNSNIASFIAGANSDKENYTPIKNILALGAKVDTTKFTAFSLPTFKKSEATGLFKYGDSEININLEDKPLGGQAIEVVESDNKVQVELQSAMFTYGYAETTKGQDIYMFVQPVDKAKTPLAPEAPVCDPCSEEVQTGGLGKVVPVNVLSYEKPVPKTISSSDATTKLVISNMKLKKDITVAVTPYKSAKFIPKVNNISTDTGLQNIIIVSGADVNIVDAKGVPTTAEKVCFCGSVSIATTHSIGGIDLSKISQDISSGNGELYLLVFKDKKWQKVNAALELKLQTGNKYSINQVQAKTLRLYPFVIVYVPKPDLVFSGSITGKITTANNEAVKGALVQLGGYDTFAVSDSSGNYTLTYTAKKADEPVTLPIYISKYGYYSKAKAVQVSSSSPNAVEDIFLEKVQNYVGVKGIVKDSEKNTGIGGASVKMFSPALVEQASASGSTASVGTKEGVSYYWYVYYKYQDGTESKVYEVQEGSNSITVPANNLINDGLYYIDVEIYHVAGDTQFTEKQRFILLKSGSTYNWYYKATPLVPGTLTAITDGSGNYKFENLPQDIMPFAVFTAEATGYQKSDGKKVEGTVVDGFYTLDFALTKKAVAPGVQVGYYKEDFETELTDKKWVLENSSAQVGWQVLKNPETVSVASALLNQIAYPDRPTVDVEGEVVSGQGLSCQEYSNWPVEETPSPGILAPKNVGAYSGQAGMGGIIVWWEPVQGATSYLVSVNDGQTIVTVEVQNYEINLSGTITDIYNPQKTLTITQGPTYQIKVRAKGTLDGETVISHYSDLACATTLGEGVYVSFKDASNTTKYLQVMPIDTNNDSKFDQVQVFTNKMPDAQYHVELAQGESEVKVGAKVIVSYPDPNKGVSLLPAFSGSHVLWYGSKETGTISDQDSNTSTIENSGTATSPVIDLTLFDNVLATMNTWYEVESVDVAGGQYDQMEIYVAVWDDSKAEGAPVTLTYGGSQVTVENMVFYEVASLNPTVEPPGMQYPHINYSSGGVNAPPTWVVKSLNLSMYAGQKIKLRFYFNTKDKQYNGFRGWTLDLLEIADQASSLPLVQPLSQAQYLSVPVIERGALQR